MITVVFSSCMARVTGGRRGDSQSIRFFVHPPRPGSVRDGNRARPDTASRWTRTSDPLDKMALKLVLHPLGVQGENNQQVPSGDSPMRTCIAVLLSSLAFALASAGSVRGEDKEKTNADKEFLTTELPGTDA